MCVCVCKCVCIYVDNRSSNHSRTEIIFFSHNYIKFLREKNKVCMLILFFLKIFINIEGLPFVQNSHVDYSILKDHYHQHVIQ